MQRACANKGNRAEAMPKVIQLVQTERGENIFKEND